MSDAKPADRRLAAIMFSDICGYSRMMNENEQRAMRVLTQHDQLVEAAIDEFDGHVIKRMGDGVLAEFHSAVRSVECALAIQNRIAVWNREVPHDEQFLVRIGVHLGDVMVSDGDIFGDGVNVASRIEPLAPPGGICISQDVYNQVHQKIEMEAVSLGPQQLKNIQRQIEIFRILTAAVDVDTEADTKLEVNAEKPAAKHRSAWFVPMLVLGVLLLAFLVLAGANKQRRLRERRTVHEAMAQAAALRVEAKPQEARELLEAARSRVRDRTPGLDELEDLIGELRAEETVQHVAGRARAFMNALLTRDWDGCVEFVHPDGKLQYGTKNIKGRMQLLGFLGDILALGDKDQDTGNVQLSEDVQSATVTVRIRVKGEWRDLKPQLWRRSEDEWYLDVE